MLNYNIQLYILALQKFICPADIIDTFSLSTQEYCDTLKNFNRDIKKLDYYIEKLYSKKNILKKHIFTFMSKDKNFNTLDDVTKLFRLKEENLVSFLNYHIKENIFLAPFIYSQANIQKSLHKITEKLVKNQIHLSKAKLFKGNNGNTKVLIEQSNKMSIEEIAFFWETSPNLIAKELCFNRKGGFWENENIRTNAPFFISNIKKQYSHEELFFLLENQKIINISELSELLKTTIPNLELLISKIKKLLTYYSNFEIKELIISKNLFKNSKHRHLIEEIKNFKKDNSKYLSDFNFENLFTYADHVKLNTYITSLISSLDYKKKLYKTLDFKIAILETKTNKYSGYLIFEDKKTLTLCYESKQTQSFMKKDLLYLKTIT